MAITKCLARGFTFELNTSGVTWVQVNGINTWSHSPQANDADTTTFDDAGRMSHMKASRGEQFAIAGLYLEDPDTAERDPGQLACEVWANAIGPDSVKNFRITSPGGEVRTFAASATVTSGGGGNDAPNAWSMAIVSSGAVEGAGIAVPAVPTSVAGSEDNTFSVVSFTTSTGSPDLYEVVVYASAVEVARIQSTAKPVYVPGLTNGTAYTAKVRAHNAGGWSALSTASSAFTPAV